MKDGITIGMDLGNRMHKAVGLDANGREVFYEEVANTPEDVKGFFERHRGATVGMETGTHCRWISALASICGCDALVGNARKLRLIFESSRKNDWRDARMLAELCRSSKVLFHPVALRSDERHKLLQMLKLRDGFVASRTRMVNMVRGMCKAVGVILPKCDAASVIRHSGMIRKVDEDMFAPAFAEIDALTEAIREYDRMIGEYVQRHFSDDDELLRTIPGVGPVTSASFIASIPSPEIFAKPRDAGAYFGLVPMQDQSGDTDSPRRISKEGSQMARRNLVTAANYILRESSRDTTLKRFGLKVRGPDGGGKVAKRKAKVAVARKLAVVMAAILKSRKPYQGDMAKGGRPA